ncbi:hypothetical protein PR202_gb05199 [Eleusine coracana subsp. coracana]|uniref:Uncharacterized protein n=1 Tax=Eleusine coracana subsp. coracana TaxID=191504 RepID=A0AAV5E6E5_ELECO|nr:hypothetical protein PR202_gb05199 [Eleusine coracana subsp. coracana]
MRLLITYSSVVCSPRKSGTVLQWIGLSTLEPRGDEDFFHTWWRRAARRAGVEARKGLNSIVILTAWYIWKHRNRVVFDGVQSSPQVLMRDIKDEAHCWVLAGARRLGRLLQ